MVVVYIFIPNKQTPIKYQVINITNARLLAKRLRVLGLEFEVVRTTPDECTAQEVLNNLATYTNVHPFITEAINTKIRGNSWLTQLQKIVPLAKD